MLRALLVTMVLLALPGVGAARDHRHTSSTASATKHHASPKTKAPGVKRDVHGKIERDPKQKASFRKNHPCPSTGRTSGACPGYEVDHVKPLACGGADAPDNMQWLSAKENRSKGAHECGR